MRIPGSSRSAATIPQICMPGRPNATSTPSPTSDLARASPPLIWTMNSLLNRDWISSPSPSAGSGAAYPRAQPYEGDKRLHVAETHLPFPLYRMKSGVRIHHVTISGCRPHQRQSTGMAMPLERLDYKPSTTTMLMLEDLERMSWSAVYSGDSSQA